MVNHGKPEAVRFENWKYREIPSLPADQITGKPQLATKELFNFSYDPSERTNVLAEFPEKAKE